jgi:hypothetical protein
MKVEDFLNSAFVAALARLPADQALKEAEIATDLCIKYWQAHCYHWAPQYQTYWKISRAGYLSRSVKERSVSSKQALHAKASGSRGS